MLVSYASKPEKSKGRKFFELPDLYRNDFEKDRERIIHSNAFKRLEYKTQVFVNHQGDHYRNRLTHSLEAANIARIVSKKLSVSEDLSECIALAHDIGHTPFGHAGEDALNKCMQQYGGFCHNNFSIKLLTELEKRYDAFDGLNLSWEVIEGIAKHNGPIISDEANRIIVKYSKNFDLELNKYPSIEAQIASICDDIAYNSHDIEDGLRAKVLQLNDLTQIEFFKKAIEVIRKDRKNIDDSILSYEVTRAFTKALVHDLIEQTSSNLFNNRIASVDDVRQLNQMVVGFSSQMQVVLAEVKSFLCENFYKHQQVTAFKCKRIVTSLFDLYFNNPECLPLEWQKCLLKEDKPHVISDYIAGMTDRYAIKEFESFYHITSI